MRWKFLGFIKFFHVRVEYILTEADLNCKDVFEMSNTIAMNVLISLQFNSRAKLFDGKSFFLLSTLPFYGNSRRCQTENGLFSYLYLTFCIFQIERVLTYLETNILAWQFHGVRYTIYSVTHTC